MARSYLKVYFDFDERTDELNDNEKARLLLAMLRYAQTGEKPVLTGNERFLFSTFKGEIDRDIAVYNVKVANGNLGGRPAKAETEKNLKEPKETEEEPKETETLKKKNKKKNIDSCSSGDNAREEGLFPVEVDPLIVKVQRELNGLTDTHYQALNDYREELTDEVVSHAIDNAVANGSRNWAYVESILRAYTQEHITTIGAAKAADEKHRANKTVKFPQKNGNGPKPYFNPYMDMLKEGVFDDIG